MRNRVSCILQRFLRQQREAFARKNLFSFVAMADKDAHRRIGPPSQEIRGPSPDAPVVTIPTGPIRILDRDLALAGIPKRDSRGWTVDVHALRHTFGTLLSKGNVAPRIAQAAMRHSSLDLTMNVYTDPQLLDVARALAALPELAVDALNRSHNMDLQAAS